MKKNNLRSDVMSSIENMLLLLPKVCNCTACVNTRKFIRIEIGEDGYRELCRKNGLLCSYDR